MNRTSNPPLKAVLIIALTCFLMIGATSAALSDETSLQQKKLATRVDFFHCKNENVGTIIRLLAEQYDLNVIVSDQVTGTLSMKLQDVTLEAAFNEILAAANAYMEEKNNILHIYPRGAKQRQDILESELTTEIFSPSYVNSGQLREVLTPFLSPEGRIQLFKDGSVNSQKPHLLIITDLPENIEIVRNLIDKLDTETRQVLIQAKIVETSLSDNETMGVDWSIGATLTGSPFKFGSEYASGGNVKFGTLSLDQFNAVLERLSQTGNTNLLSDTSLATVDGETATIHVGESIPVGVNTIGTGGSGGVSFGTTGFEDVRVGVQLQVTPHILNDETIHMDVSPQISSVKGFTSLGGGVSQAPITSERMATTNILVRDGETLVIGGLVQDSVIEQRKKVPILGNLPLVGNLFRSKSVSKEKTDLIIFITAVIMDHESD